MRRLPSERGAAMVETIMVLPILFLVMFAIVELSRAWFTLQVATTAAREGVRVAAVALPADVSQVGEARVDAILAASNITGSGIVIRQDIAEVAGTEEQEVVATVTVVFNTVFPLLLPASLQSLTITQTAAMRHEGGPVSP